MDFKNKTFLSLDSACGAGSVAVFLNGECKAFLLDEVKGNQAKNLVLMVEQALAKAGICYGNLDAIVSTIGPGSFTGIRIALSAARAFGLALSKPVFGVSTLACIAHKSEKPALAMIYAGKNEAYVQESGIEGKCSEIILMLVEEIREKYRQHKFYGQVDILKTSQGEAYVQLRAPDARVAGELVICDSSKALAPEPLYIRPPDAKLPNQI